MSGGLLLVFILSLSTGMTTNRGLPCMKASASSLSMALVLVTQPLKLEIGSSALR